MDYTSFEQVKIEIGAHEATDDSKLAVYVTAASRSVDRYCTGVQDNSGDNYFAISTLTDKVVMGWMDSDGYVMTYLHKPTIISVASLSWRLTPRDAWTAVTSTDIITDGSPLVRGYVTGYSASRVFIKATYTGGLAATTSALPSDFIENVAVIAARFYREGEAGVSDVIGVGDLGQLMYRKALPNRVMLFLSSYVRRIPWRL